MSNYRTIQHKIPCQHLREYPRATDEEEDILHLAVKQYVPLNNPNPQPGDVTIIAAHANGFPKELYEPLWEDLIDRTQKHGFKIRSIWMADVSQQGESGVLNEDKLGDDPSWFDHSRDLLHMINMKREEMPRPLVAIGHSMGGAQLVNLAYFHPTLFTTMILLDPVIQIKSAELRPGASNIARLSTFRRDTWPSRQVAADSFLKSPFYQTWDPRVFSRWVEHGLRDLPTPAHPTTQTNDPPQVTLTTTVANEVRTFLRPNYSSYGGDNNPVNRTTHADVDPGMDTVSPFYRAEAPSTFYRLPTLRPSVLYVFAELSTTATPAFNEAKLTTTGVGVGGSGGAKEGRVSSVMFDGVGHLIPMEDVGRSADVSAEWIGKELERWRGLREERERWRKIPLRERQALTEEWKSKMGGPPKRGKRMGDSKI